MKLKIKVRGREISLFSQEAYDLLERLGCPSLEDLSLGGREDIEAEIAEIAAENDVGALLPLDWQWSLFFREQRALTGPFFEELGRPEPDRAVLEACFPALVECSMCIRISKEARTKFWLAFRPLPLPLVAAGHEVDFDVAPFYAGRSNVEAVGTIQIRRI